MTGAEFSGVDIDLLADYVGGALDGTPDEAEVTALIAGDPAWRVAHDELTVGMAAVGVRLNALGATDEPMPAELATRLDVAFAAATLTVTAPDTTSAPNVATADRTVTSQTVANHSGVDAVADPSAIDPELAAPAVPHLVKSERHLSAVPDDGVDLETGERAGATSVGRRRRLRWAASLAAAAGVIAFAGLGINYLTARSPSSNDYATSAAAGSDAGRGSDTADAPQSVPEFAAPLAGDSVYIASGTDYRSGTLSDGIASRAQAAAPDSGVAEPPHAPSAKSFAADPEFPAEAPFALVRLTTRETMQACLDAIEVLNGGGSIMLQSVDFARYEGSPALVVRFRASNGEWAWASGPDCGVPGVGAAKLAAVKVG